jgi:uncharacterized protein with FMN-binding domain
VKRIIFSVVGTVLGLVALLSFKSQGTPIGAGNGLPSAALPVGGSSATVPRAGAANGAPPNPSGTSVPQAASQTVLGDPVQTQYGVVQVRVTLAGSKITNVAFAQLTAYDDRSQEINNAAAPILLQQTLSAQNSQIDGVSGASYTSQGYTQSLQSALDKARAH